MKKTTYLAFCLSTILVLMASWIIPKGHSQEATSNFRLIVSFISFASGIDWEVKKEIDEYICNYETEKNVKLVKEEVPWGKEGEIDYCFKLIELSQTDQESFISEIKSLAEESQQINVRENSPCGTGVGTHQAKS